MVANLPNILTVFRVLLIPIVIAALYIDSPVSHWIAFLAFVSACLTDFLDGYIARLWSQTSKFGQILDPIADKLLVASILLLIVGFGKVSPISFLPAVAILFREIIVSGLREFLASIEVKLPVSNFAKWKTAIQMISLSFLLVGDSTFFGSALPLIGEILLWVSAILTLVSGYKYLRLGIRYI